MKLDKITILTLIFFLQVFLSSCDATRTTRKSSNGTSSSSVYDYDGNSSTSSSGSLLDDNDDDDDDDDDSDSSSSLTIPTGATSCNWSEDGDDDFTYGGAHFADDETTLSAGAYNICQNSSSDTTIYFQIDNPIDNEQICFIPMFNSTSGYSYYLGEPRCLMASSDKRIYTITLYKNRTGYTSFGVNGVMMLRDKSYYYTSPYPTAYKTYSVDAYLYCANYLAAYNSDVYCQAFAAGSHYVFHQFE